MCGVDGEKSGSKNQIRKRNLKLGVFQGVPRATNMKCEHENPKHYCIHTLLLSTSKYYETNVK